MINEFHSYVETSIKEVKLIVNDGLKYRRIYTIISSTLSPEEESELVQWYSTTTDVMSPTREKEWKEMTYNEGSKLEKSYQESLTIKK